MSLTRKKLKAIGLSEEQIESVIEDHTETVKGLQADAEAYQRAAELLPEVQRELERLKSAADGVDYKSKYEKERSAFEDFKRTQAARETKVAKERAFRDIIGAAGVPEKRIDSILRICDLSLIELDEDQHVTNGEALTQRIKQEFSDFIVTKTETGIDVMTPPGGDGERDLGRLDMAAYIAERKKSMKG